MFQWDSVVDQANGVIRWYVITCDDDEGNNLMVSNDIVFIKLQLMLSFNSIRIPKLL